MPRRAAELEVAPRVDLTPMIDIVFNLLIFFMCATKFRSTEGLIMCFLPKIALVQRHADGILFAEQQMSSGRKLFFGAQRIGL